MKLYYAGKFDGNPEHLINQRFVEGSVKFKEPSYKLFALLGNVVAIAILVLTIFISFRRGGSDVFHIGGFIISFISLVPHELLHAICFRGDVYMYTALSKGMLFVVGSEDMTKGRYIFMSMLPNLVFGFIPFIIFLINPSLNFLGTLGAFAIAYGAGDYINVFNALTQVPKQGQIYLYQQNSYWHIP